MAFGSPSPRTGIPSKLAQLLERQGPTVLSCPLLKETPIEDATATLQELLSGMLRAGTIHASDMRYLFYTDSVQELSDYVASAVPKFGVIPRPSPLRILRETGLRPKPSVPEKNRCHLTVQAINLRLWRFSKTALQNVVDNFYDFELHTVAPSEVGTLVSERDAGKILPCEGAVHHNDFR